MPAASYSWVTAAFTYTGASAGNDTTHAANADRSMQSSPHLIFTALTPASATQLVAGRLLILHAELAKCDAQVDHALAQYC